jgi:hypothetical protein
MERNVEVSFVNSIGKRVAGSPIGWGNALRTSVDFSRMALSSVIQLMPCDADIEGYYAHQQMSRGFLAPAVVVSGPTSKG